MVVYATDEHQKHAPSQQFVNGRMVAYPEVPARVDAIRSALESAGIADAWEKPEAIDRDAITRVHKEGFVSFLETAYDEWSAVRGCEGELIPDTFAMRGLEGRPESVLYQAGYYCFETQSPITAGTWGATRAAAACAFAGAESLLSGEQVAYALCRPPGHHASSDVYGGYCYLNHAAIAAGRLAEEMKTAVLDVDYHHGNGTQAIFYGSDSVLFCSLHANPEWEYPHFSGYADETGEGRGLGFTRNVPLPAETTDAAYLDALEVELEAIRSFGAEVLVVSLGVDTVAGDPLSDFDMTMSAFTEIGRRIASLQIPTLYTQEGGYSLKHVGPAVSSVLSSHSKHRL